MDKLLRWLALLFILTATGCIDGYANRPASPHTPPGSPSPVPTFGSGPPPSPAPTSAMPAEARATYRGRVWHLDPNQPDHVLLSWAGVAAGVHFVGTGLQMQVNPGAAGQQTWVDVVVDGNAASPQLITADSRVVMLAEHLPPVEHTLWLTKRTEASFGVVDLDHFAVADGGNFLAPPALATRTIEVVGASMEVGFGTLGQNCNDYDAVNFESENLAYGHVTADLLGAVESNLSFSGYGLLVSGTGPVAAGYTMQDFFTRTDPFVVASPWNLAQHPVDVVIFDLGANDYNFYNGMLPEPDFTNAYVSFVKAALAAYPKAQVYVVLSPTITSAARPVLDAAYQQVVQQLQATSAGRVHYFPFAATTGEGCYGHPLPALHAQMAADLSAQIQRDLGHK